MKNLYIHAKVTQHCVYYQVMGMFEKKDWISQYPRYRQDGTKIMHTYESILIGFHLRLKL